MNRYKNVSEDKLLELAVGHIVSNTDIPKPLYDIMKKLGVTQYLPEDKIIEAERAYRKRDSLTPKRRKRTATRRPDKDSGAYQF